jgi:hypothetical protein
MPKKEHDAKSRFEINSRREDIFGNILLFGLFIETSTLFLFPDNRSWLELSIDALAYIMVFGGVFGEIRFASRAKSADAELKRESEILIEKLRLRSEEAQERASKADLEAAKIKSLLSWRNVSEEQIGIILENFIGKSPKEIIFRYEKDPEASIYSADLEELFRQLDEKESKKNRGFIRYQRPDTLSKDRLFGLHIMSRPRIYAENVFNAFSMAKIELKINNHLMRHFEGYGATTPYGKEYLLIFVGHKPRHTLDWESNI